MVLAIEVVPRVRSKEIGDVLKGCEFWHCTSTLYGLETGKGGGGRKCGGETGGERGMRGPSGGVGHEADEATAACRSRG
jgi:hypothetical protein